MEKWNATRRRFLVQSASMALGTGGLSACLPGRVRQAAAEGTVEQPPAFHSRHIPEPWLNFETPTGRNVKRNGLCDTLDGDVLRRLKDQGIELIETRLVWWELEAKAGRFDWMRVERAIDRIEQAGLKAGLMCWFQHPPAWYDPDHTAHARYRCLEHDSESSILSLWDPATLEVYHRLLEAVAARLGDRLSFVYAMVSGDYGEVCYPSGVKHYRFSPEHGHHGHWSGDRRARASFRQALREKYATVGNLNAAWGTQLSGFDDDLMPKLPLSDSSLICRRDYMTWYTESLLSFTDRVCVMYRKYFPQAAVSLPIGFPNERLAVGQVKSRAVKIAAKHGITARWTGCAFLRSFPKSNVLARRVASAAHYYGTPFGTEAALILEKENAANGLYEGMANAASQIHDDPQNILRAVDVHRRLRPKLVVDPPECGVAVYYPVESEMLETPGFESGRFIARCASLRAVADYDLCDSFMLRDGYLADKSDLVLVSDCRLPKDVVPLVLEFVRDGGRVWIPAACRVSSLEDDLEVVALAEKRGCAIHRGCKPGQSGFYRFDDWPAFEPYASLHARDSEGPTYWTVHRQRLSAYSVKRQDFDVRTRTAER